MNAILNLCHFCEIHGPTVLLSTQAFHCAGDDDNRGSATPTAEFFGPLKKLGEYSAVISQNVNKPACEACNSVNGYITNDYKNKISYLSTRVAVDNNVSLLLQQAAVRSLSCEVVPGKEGQIYFGDSVRGHVLSYTFFLKDTKARGFHRWYSIVVFMRDKHFLLNSWMFFQKHIKELVCNLQSMASQVYTNEQNKMSQRALRLTLQEQAELDTRSLIKLTASSTVFAKIHLWFSWLLSIGARRLEEQLPSRGLDCRLLEKQECEGFIIVEDLDNSENYLSSEETIREIRKLRNSLGFLKFQCLLYSTLIGHQIVIRGPQTIVQHVINLLRCFLPKKKFHCIEYTDCYQTPDICNIIGLNLYAAVPKPTLNISRLDIVPSSKAGSLNIINSTTDFSNYELLLKTGFDVPVKWPTLLSKTDKALADQTLSDRVVLLHINSIMEEWINLTDVVIEAKTRRRNVDLTGLLKCLSVQDQDDQLIDFWAS